MPLANGSLAKGRLLAAVELPIELAPRWLPRGAIQTEGKESEVCSASAS